jgi:hypothetical protein
MTLTPAQTAALTSFREFLNRPEEPGFLLRGYAGTGKTYLLQALLAELAQRQQRAVLLAPTGRAARVMAQQTGRTEAATIHRGIYDFTQLRPLQTEGADADKSFKFFFGLRLNTAPKGTVFVVDEASMVADAFSESEFFRLGSGHLLRDLLAYVKPTPANGYKLLLVGDRAQLPPVGDADSWALDASWLTNNLGGAPIREIELTDVVRQAAGSGILANATAVREALRLRHFAGLKLTPGTDVRQLESGGLLPAYLAAGGSPEALNQAIIITYSNNLAQKYNAQVRRHFFGAGFTEEFPAQPTIQVGDRLMVTQNNYLDLEEPVYNGEFAAVRQIGAAYSRMRRVTVNKTAVQVTLTWRPVRLGFVRPDGTSYEIERLLLNDFLTSADNALRSEQVKALYVDAVIRWRERTGHSEKHAEFGKFLKSDPHFHALRAKYGYAVTCHKAQGGTWHTAFVDFAGHSGQAHAHYFRWVYTALTRASQTLYLLNDGSFTPWEKMRVFTTPPPPPKGGGVALFPEVLQQQTAQFDPLEALEKRLGITGRPLPQVQQFRRVARQLQDVGFEVDQVSDGQNALRYGLRRGGEAAEVVAYYSAANPFSSVQPGKSSTATAAAVARLREPLPEAACPVPVVFDPNGPPALASFYELFAERAAAVGIVILTVQPKPYLHRYQLQDDTGRAVVLFDYDRKGRMTNARVDQHDSPELLNKLDAILRFLD